MELRHLRHFVAVAEELHFARAADRLGMEQSPLSQSIRKLEARLGTKLFQRTTRRTWLTPAGTRLYREARRILRDVDDLKASMQRGNGEEPRSVRIALSEDLASEPFTQLLFQLEHHEPKVALEVRECVHAEAIRLARDSGADVAISLNPRAEPEMARTRGWSEPIMAVVPIGHPFGAFDRISLRDLTGQTLALPSSVERPGCLAQMEDLLGRHKVRPAQRLEVRHWNTAISFAATGHAIALCPVTMVHAATAVLMVPLEEEGAELVTWILYREGEVSPAVSLVLEIAAEVASEPFLSVFADVPA
ncbi:MAG: LysR family transcriptional regulator [Sphingomonas taxi]